MGQIHAPFSTSPTSTADDAPDADPPRVKETSAIGGGGPGSTTSEEEEEEEEEESQGEFVVKKKKMKRERVVASKGAVKARQKTRTSMNMSLRHRTGSEKGEKRFSVYIYIYGPEAHTCSPPPHQL